jgi:hypothetical protein
MCSISSKIIICKITGLNSKRSGCSLSPYFGLFFKHRFSSSSRESYYSATNSVHAGTGCCRDVSFVQFESIFFLIPLLFLFLLLFLNTRFLIIFFYFFFVFYFDFFSLQPIPIHVYYMCTLEIFCDYLKYPLNTPLEVSCLFNQVGI